jgi:hypothetical protein
LTAFLLSILSTNLIENKGCDVAQREKALAFVEGLTFDDVYFNVLIKLACISSSAKIHKEMYGIPERSNMVQADTNPFWIQWDLGRALVTILVEYCSTRNVDPRKSCFWPLLDRHYQQSYFEQYEFGRQVDVKPYDFEQLCKAITNDNTVLIGDFRLSPRDVDESTGHYGEEVFWRKWLLEKNSKHIEEFHTDCYSLAENVFRIINDRNVENDEQGEMSRRLQCYSRSFHDTYFNAP